MFRQESSQNYDTLVRTPLATKPILCHSATHMRASWVCNYSCHSAVNVCHTCARYRYSHIYAGNTSRLAIPLFMFAGFTMVIPQKAHNTQLHTTDFKAPGDKSIGGKGVAFGICGICGSGHMWYVVCDICGSGHMWYVVCDICGSGHMSLVSTWCWVSHGGHRP